MIRLPRACRGRTAVRFPVKCSHVCCVELTLKELASAGKGLNFWGLNFGKFFPFLLPTFSSLLVVFAVLCIAFALCRKFFGVFWTQITWSSGNWHFYANCRFFLAISVFLPLIASLL